MTQAKWIWYPGDFEIYHSNLLHARREDFGVDYPSFWMHYSPYPRVDFTKTISCESARTITVHSRSYGMVMMGDSRFALNQPFTVPAGIQSITVRLLDAAGLPCIYIDDEVWATDSGWSVSNGSVHFVPAGDSPAYTSSQDDPRIFAFSYTPIQPVATEQVDGGVLYDFGKESFGPVTLSGLDVGDTVHVCYGESREEALTWEEAYTRQVLQGQESYQLKARAFRYLHIRTTGKHDYTLQAQYEYLPIQDVASFSCEDPLVKKIWDTCAYTFHLNSREFYLDGIKRDRWVWSGDAYQSYMINRYLYFDPAITKRTILALLGKPPYEQHVNTINDYTLYLLIAVWEYYYATGDTAFVQLVWPRVKALYGFVIDRLDGNGLVCDRPGDWIFIDWSPMDKAGPICAEQILLWQASNCVALLAQLCGDAADSYQNRAAALKTTIEALYWDEEKHAYIDTFASGKRNVTRHANIFAILYDFADETRKRQLMEHVLENDAITQITTPYFKFFELMARCSMGDLASSQQLLISYWGGMLKDGATSVWEQYDPTLSGVEHYAMYGQPFGCSLCHAWGSGPIFLLGRYCLGVYPTSVGYGTFCVQPNAGIYSQLHGVVPLPDGTVQVDYQDGVLRVLATRDGGTLRVGGKEYPLFAGLPFELACKL